MFPVQPNLEVTRMRKRLRRRLPLIPRMSYRSLVCPANCSVASSSYNIVIITDSLN
jgi:hypothetical protein